jgi:hypothetical protein
MADAIPPSFARIAGARAEGLAMQTIMMDGMRGLRLVISLNWDRVFFLGTILAGLLAGAFLGQALILALPPGGG